MVLVQPTDRTVLNVTLQATECGFEGSNDEKPFTVIGNLGSS